MFSSFFIALIDVVDTDISLFDEVIVKIEKENGEENKENEVISLEDHSVEHSLFDDVIVKLEEEDGGFDSSDGDLNLTLDINLADS